MKQFIFCLLFVLFFATSFRTERIFNSVQKLNYTLSDEEEWVEYVYDSGQWYQITHHKDGSVTIVPVLVPPHE